MMKNRHPRTQTTFKETSLLGLCFLLLLFVLGCEQNTDGPLSITDEKISYDGEGFFKDALLDSGHTIHLVQDTLFLSLGKIWSFSNCALQAIDLQYEQQDSVLWISPVIKIHATGEDCASPFYGPDTLLKLKLEDKFLKSTGIIKVKNDQDSVLDSILVRRGSFSVDTFAVYMDSSFADAKNFPLRTRGRVNKKDVPSILRVLDSLTPRVFYWKIMESKCTHRVDMCKNVVADTIYPSSWNINDTNLVPVHYACADSDSVYCINSKWENDSSALGKLQERPDTIWHYSTYYVEKIPECASYEDFSFVYYSVGSNVRFTRKMFVPGDDEKFCGPSSRKDWMVYKLPHGLMVQDSNSFIDSLYEIWKGAEIAPDSLVVKADSL